jgi:acyl-CoA synthetase (AMP-forming)/AMP-acid ligase II
VTDWLLGVSAHAAATPDKPAMVTDAETISFAELDRRSNQGAQVFRGRGVRPGDRVGIALRNRPESSKRRTTSPPMC